MSCMNVEDRPAHRGRRSYRAINRAAAVRPWQCPKDATPLGIHSMLDDPDVTAGVKFYDADLIGHPSQVTVGRSFSDGKVEIRSRACSSAMVESSLDSAIETLKRS